MSIQFRKTSIRSRRRTLALAALGLLMETITSHPKFNAAAVVNVAMMSRFAAAPLMASIGGLMHAADPHAGVVSASAPLMIGPSVDLEDVAWNCARIRRGES